MSAYTPYSDIPYSELDEIETEHEKRTINKLQATYDDLARITSNDPYLQMVAYLVDAGSIRAAALKAMQEKKKNPDLSGGTLHSNETYLRVLMQLHETGFSTGQAARLLHHHRLIDTQLRAEYKVRYMAQVGLLDVRVPCEKRGSKNIYELSAQALKLIQSPLERTP